MVSTISKEARNLKNFFRLWKRLLVFALLSFFLPGKGAVKQDSLNNSSVPTVVLVERGVLIYLADNITHAELIFIAQKSNVNEKEEAASSTIRRDRPSRKQPSESSAKNNPADQGSRNVFSLVALSDQRLSDRLLERSLVMGVLFPYDGVKAVYQKHRYFLSPIILPHLQPYFGAFFSFLNAPVLWLPFIRPPPLGTDWPSILLTAVLR